ncbi:MAG: hypothetical protein ABEJ95_02225 [Candidatus Nanohalobium sp.]
MKGFNGEELEDRRTVTAYVVSTVFYPALTFPVGLLLFLYFNHRSTALNWMPIGLLTAAAPILLYTYSYTREKEGSTLDSSDREGLYLFATPVFALTYLTYFLLDSPPVFQRIAAVATFFTLIYRQVNLKTKISIHTGAIATATTLNFYNPFLMVLLAFSTVLTGWARLHLERHSLKQIVLGSVLGIIAGLLMALPS